LKPLKALEPDERWQDLRVLVVALIAYGAKLAILSG
jgi:hypothetical protein